MSVTFNADEIFEMAEEIERNGATFYREAAEKSSDKDALEFLKGMADMEEEHFRIFAEMRKELNEKDKEPVSFDPDNEAAMYLQAMADAHGTEGKISVDKKLTGSESINEVLEIAINAEKDSISYYSALKDYVPSSQDKINKIIREEIGHLAILKNELQKRS